MQTRSAILSPSLVSRIILIGTLQIDVLYLLLIVCKLVYAHSIEVANSFVDLLQGVNYIQPAELQEDIRIST
jgi:hypothetical protein